MGFSLSGIAIADNFEKEIANVSKNLEIGIEVLKEVDPYEATQRIDDEKNLYIAFSETATLIYYEASLFDQNYYSQTAESINYQYFEGPMLFAIRYTKDCETVRNLLSIDENIEYSTGRKLKVESETKRIDEVVVNLVDTLTGLNLLRIPEQTKVFKCRIVDYKHKRVRKSEKEINAMITERRIGRSFNLGHHDTFEFI